MWFFDGPFLLAFVCLEVAGFPNKLSKGDDHATDSCKSTYSCAGCHTSRVCRAISYEKFQAVGTVQCSADRPYCDSITGTCVSERQLGCTEELSNSIAVHYNFSTSCKKIFSCKDCHNAQVCKPNTNGSFNVLITIRCSEDRPYCHSGSGTCVAEEPIECGRNGKFVCMKDGKFPDADCKSYHECNKLHETTLVCPEADENYDPKTGTCNKLVPCKSFSCQGNSGRKVPHPLDPHYFAFCGSQEPIVIDSCPGSYELNYTSQLCEATCHQNGLIEDMSDCHFYYKCTEVFVTNNLKYFLKERKQCPNGQAYNPSESHCVSDIAHIPRCKE